MSTLVIILAVVAMLALVASPLTISGWNTDGEEGSSHGYTFKVNLTKDKYVVSWKSNVDSEDITATVTVKRTAVITGAIVQGVRLNFYVNGQLIDSKPTATGYYGMPHISVWEGGHWYLMAAATTHVKGNMPGKLTVKAQVKIADPFGNVDKELAWDGAYLKSGKGSVYLSGDQGPFETGSTATVAIETGYSPDGWTAKLYPPMDRADLSSPIDTKTFENDKRTTWSIKIQDGWFKAGTSNEFRVELWNDYFEEGFTQIFAVDDLSRIPVITDIAVQNNGDSMTYTITANRTYANLDKVTVWAWYGYGGTTMPSTEDTESWVLYAADYSFSGNTATFEVKPKNQDGTIVVKAVAYDVDGRTSEPYLTSVIVKAGSTSQGGNPNNGQFLWTTPVIALVAGAIAIPGIIIAFAPWDPTRKFAIGFAIAGFLLLIAYLAGTGIITLQTGSESFIGLLGAV